ncbi:hypothetical protein PR202_ga30022 [Eleusine coracana subsp. coracana]|uniref:Protein kinase domain-containing protein n=1 Tax=Eleusine coracana subsp. coracana TaxID=191504 RepID=A0AAV5DPF8_ELECO|nr:hypothetical protein PR202_ga30007 [Eleusine coracana subsp. coracana]GJN11799.1 hypothetical protein PR202_ga30022 [Eleusine coracana subsp. coracana]
MPGTKQKRFVLCALLYFCSLDLASFTFADDQLIYSGFVQANLSLDGTATITRDGLLELTNGGFNLKGHAFYPTPLSLRMSPGGNVQSFESIFIFSILSAYSDKSADGMAFLVTANKNFSDAFPAQYLGLLNDHNNGNTSNNIFAVELDTIQNSEFQDINDNHVGINVNSLQSVEAQNAAFYDETTAIIILARKKLAYSELLEDWEIEFGAHRFSYKDLFRATDGFKNKNMLWCRRVWKGVYKGVLPTSKLEIAVKRLSHESKQGMKEFINEIVSIGHLRHRNLVQLLGYCRRKGELLLVYDYMPNGSLDKYIYYEQNSPSLDWSTRFHIIKGIACGLLYLHEKWDKVVIHRDIKASNVLLDYGLNGRLGDFGLAKSYNHGTDPQTTHMVGTVGYLDPELARTGKASPLTDVFAFGTLLLEVTCGKRPVKHNALGDRFMLVDWVFDHWQKGSIVETIDERLQGDCNIDEACLVLKLGLLCSQPLASARPGMHLVMQYLNGDMPLPEITPSDMSFSMLAMMEIGGSIHPPCHTHN